MVRGGLGIAVRLLVVALVSLPGAAISLAQTPAAKVKCSDDAPRPLQSRAINGTPAKASAWPWFAALQVRDDVKKVSLAFCGGAIIAPNWVLTAGHCMHFIDKGTLRTSYYGSGDPTNFPINARLEVVAGVDDLRQAKPENVFEVAEIIMHDDYAVAYDKWVKDTELAKLGQGPWPVEPAQSVGNDLALVRLARAWSGPLAPTAISDAADIPADGHARVAGFGTVEVAKDALGNYFPKLRRYTLPDQRTLYAGCAHLMQVTMPVVATSDCLTRFTEGNSAPVIGEKQICAGYEFANQDSCSGDSGGPLMVAASDGRQQYAGIVSWGPSNCAGIERSYGVYTRISKYAGWIEQRAAISLPRPLQMRSVSAQDRASFVRFALDDLKIDLADVKGNVRLTIENGPVVKLKQFYSLNVVSDVSGRLIIIDVDAANKVTQIFPNKYVSSEDAARIKANEAKTIPAEGWAFDAFQASEPLGAGVLVAVVVPDDFPKLTYGEEMEHQASQGLVPVQKPTSYVMNLIQQIGQQVEKERASGAAVKDGWAFDSVDYEIVP